MRSGRPLMRALPYFTLIKSSILLHHPTRLHLAGDETIGLLLRFIDLSSLGKIDNNTLHADGMVPSVS